MICEKLNSSNPLAKLTQTNRAFAREVAEDSRLKHIDYDSKFNIAYDYAKDYDELYIWNYDDIIKMLLDGAS